MVYRETHTRSGMILLVVVAFLALGLSVGIAFVFFAHQQAISMRIYREAADGGRGARLGVTSRGNGDESPPPSFDIANSALGNLIYDAADDESGIWNGLRGGSLSRSMYGLYYDGTPQAPTYAKNDVAFNGIGRPRETLDADVPNLLRSVSNPNARAVHFTYFPSDGFLRDPERIGFRSGPQATTWSGGSRNYFPLNASYTYPDEKDIALAAIRARDGQVISTSFYRPSTFGSLSPDNPNWTNGVGKYLLHRPRPIDMGPGFPAVPANPDGSYTGDVEQLEGKAVRRNDSLWLDLDLPVRTWRGRLYKPLVAFLVTDLDGRINLNMAGNTRGIDDRTASNLGLGGWEIDLQPLFPFDESRRLFQDANGRYGSRAKPSRSYSETGNVAANETAFAMRSPYYAPVDLDGSLLTDSGLRPRMEMPGVPSTRTAPNFPPRYAGGSTAERVDHPSLFNPFLLSTMPSLSSTKPNRAAARRTAYRPRRSIAIDRS